jgi:hypothetical protein
MKYIEKPLLLNHQNDIRKFDIRQWVLVTSFDPLQIYTFSDFYLRICGSKYELNDISDSYKHLTNFSIQKHNTNVTNKKDDLVMSKDEFFRRTIKNDKAKCDMILKSFDDIVIKTLKTGQDSGIEHKSNCFEIYGFDFMLDQKLKPWLLEVNLSPACAERTEWLVKMLDNMTKGLFNILEQRISKVSDDFKGDLKSHLIKKRKKKITEEELGGWKLIYDQSSTKDWLNHLKAQASTTTIERDLGYNLNLEVTGQKINERNERKVQQLHLQSLASQVIQRRYRGYRARKVYAQMKMELVVIYLQSHFRMFLAKCAKMRLKQQKCSIVVQKILRRYLAKKIYFKMRSEAYDLMKLNKLKMIQKNVRLFIQRQRVKREYRSSKALLVQRFIKGRQTWGKIRAYRDYVTKVRRIQLFYRRRLALKSRCALLVQKYLRGREQFLRYQRLAQVKRATGMIT